MSHSGATSTKSGIQLVSVDFFRDVCTVRNTVYYMIITILIWDMQRMKVNRRNCCPKFFKS